MYVCMYVRNVCMFEASKHVRNNSLQSSPEFPECKSCSIHRDFPSFIELEASSTLSNLPCLSSTDPSSVFV